MIERTAPKFGRWATAVVCSWVTPCLLAGAQDLRLHLKGTGKAESTTARYRCDATGAALGLPAGEFAVRYIRMGDNSLAILPLHGQDRVFVQLVSADGGRYGAGAFVWWDARTTTFSDGEGDGSKTSTCRAIR